MHYYTGPLKTVTTEHGDRPTTKRCPVCDNTNLVPLKKFNEKICTAHKEFIVIPWHCDEGQKQLQ